MSFWDGFQLYIGFGCMLAALSFLISRDEIYDASFTGRVIFVILMALFWPLYLLFVLWLFVRSFRIRRVKREEGNGSRDKG